MGTIPELAAWIKARDNIAVVAHVSPDGDTLGSGLALVAMLRKMGKHAALVSKDAIPHMYRFLPGMANIYAPEALPFAPECLLYEDAAAKDRAGDRGAFSHIEDTALIDHHGTNPCFAALCVIDADAPATGVLVFRLMDELGVPLDQEIAEVLYTAITTDTGNLSFASTTPEAVRDIARCIETGFDFENVNLRLFRMRSRPRTKLLGLALSAMEFKLGGRIAVTKISGQMYKDCGAAIPDTEGIINIMIETEGVEIAVVAEERAPGMIKFSLRSDGRVDVGTVAHSFGGGGHKQAAGLQLEMALDDAADVVLKKLYSILEA